MSTASSLAQTDAPTTASVDSTDRVIDKVFEELTKESEILGRLLPRMNQIEMLRSRGQTDERIATSLAAALSVPVASILLFLNEHRPNGRRADTTRTDAPLPSYQLDSRLQPPVGRPRRIKVSSTQIRQAIQAIMTERKLKVFRMTDEASVNEVIERVPDLKRLQTHDRNRRIVDACAGRKHGPIVRSRDGTREIILAA